VAELGETVTLTTGWLLTVTSAVACTVSTTPDVHTFTRSVEVPTLKPVTLPVAFTDATVGVDELHATCLPAVDNGSPDESKRLTVSWSDCPTSTVAAGGATAALATDAICTVTVVLAVGVVPCGPPPGARTVTVTTPGVMAVSSPFDATVAMASLLESQVSCLAVATCLSSCVISSLNPLCFKANAVA
jgi:hypothetical protein